MACSCIRCRNVKPPADPGVPENHSLSHCYQKWSLEKNGLPLWSNFPNVGTPQDQVGDYYACERLLAQHDNLRAAETARIGGDTKYMMEKAFRKVYNPDGSKVQPPAPHSTVRRGAAQGFATRSRGTNNNTSHRLGHTFQRGRGSSASYTPVTRGSSYHSTGRANRGDIGSQHSSLKQVLRPQDLAVQQKFERCDLDVYDGLQPQELEGTGSKIKAYGAPVRTVTNHIALNGVPNKVYRYTINFGEVYAEGSSDRKSPVTQRSIKSLALDEFCQSKSFNNKPFGTDCVTFWCLEDLRGEDLVAQDVRFSKLSGRVFIVTHISLKFDQCIAFHRFGNHDPLGNTEASRSLVGRLQTLDGDQSALRSTALNALFSHYAHHRTLNSASNTPANSDPHASTSTVPDGLNKIFLTGGYDTAPARDEWLVMLRGYFTSIRPGQHQPLININIATAAFFKPERLSVVYDQIQTSIQSHNVHYPPPDRLLRGLRVSIAYERQRHGSLDPNIPANRHRVITEFGETPDRQHFVADGTETTVKAQFEAMGYRLSRLDLPCANLGAKLTSRSADQTSHGQNQAQPQIWIPLELLNLDQGQRFPKVLQGKHSDMMIKSAVRRPAQNQCLIVKEGFSCLGIGSDSSIQQRTGLQLGSSLVSIPATMLESPWLLYGSNGGPNAGDRPLKPLSGSWNLKDCKFLSARYGPHTTVRALDFCSPAYLHETPTKTDFMAGLSGVMKGHNMICDYTTDGKSRIHMANPTTDDDFRRAVEMNEQAVHNSNLLIAFMPRRQKLLYGIIKRVCDQELGIPTVCVSEMQFQDERGNWKTRGGHFLGPAPQLYSNLAMKINFKLGGLNHCVVNPNNESSKDRHPSSPFDNLDKDTIVLGADVTHCAYVGRTNIPSIAAVVGSYDNRFVNFRGAVRLQPSRQETISSFQDMILEHLTTYRAIHKKLPKRIIFYRDGVGEDQFSACVREELSAISNGFEKARALSSDPAPIPVSICFIVAGKRHNTRFYAAKSGGSSFVAGRWDNRNQKYVPNGNLKPGLLVDSVITRPDVGDGVYDFFLQSHAAIQGTARSAHYTVLSDGGLKPQQIVELTHAFCYNYQRATKAVSYPSPAYYADRLCARAALYLEGAIEKIARGSEAKKGQLDKTAEEIALPNDEAQSRMAERLVELLSSKWLAPNRSNPWHPNMDKIMFWL
ncbi:Piwi-domain-containing protein [Polychaeton citri CBS 116435]|uniref:Piwi-domain-containing protein n=1 Tax=Polychaeton citri CBS 116435 TaxID=1314669 RepID=A0A9P4QJB3_9PEZI|nr:Piwi-domain-containing protein [Polychaeton citri CBS 116435]